MVAALTAAMVLSLSMLCAPLLSASAHAHQLKTAITTVLFNPRTNNIEVMHRFNVHDAEHAVQQIFDKQADIIKKPETQQKFARYVTERFAIYTPDKTKLNLSYVGHEMDNKHFWVYQEVAAPQALEGLYMQHNALRDIWQKQINTINIEGMGEIKTLTFTESTELLKVEFNQH